MEINEGYKIIQKTIFDNNSGIALGCSPNAPQTYVTWQFNISDNGLYDYYWGHYFSTYDAADNDYMKRVKDYREQEWMKND